MSESNVSVLLVDDDDIDRMAVVRAFRRLQVSTQIVEARDGLQALEIIRQNAADDSASAPYLVLLDLSMPRMDGFEFLKTIREHPALHRMVVFVLTTSGSDEDKAAAYNQNVAGYIVKADYDGELRQVVELIDQYQQVVEFP